MAQGESVYKVYQHITPDGKRYIGVTQQTLLNRWRNHYAHNKAFNKAIKQYGWRNMSHEIIKDNLSKEEAYSLEQKIIKKYDTTNPNKGFNISVGGEAGRKGIKHTELSKEKMRKSHIGKKRAESSIKKGALANMGKIHNPRKAIICIETDIIYASSHHAEHYLGINNGNINRACKTGGRAGGYHWQFV